MRWLKLSRSILLSPFTASIAITTAGMVQAAEPTVMAQQERPERGAPAPGEFDIDPEAAERALERTLIQSGVLLLSPGQLGIEAGVAYTRSERVDPGPFFQAGGQFVSSTQDLRRNIVDTSIDFRLGTPLDSQLELRIPYRYVDQSRVTQVGPSVVEVADRKGSGLGDIRVGLAKTLLREARGRPDVIARVAWDTGTGEMRDGDVLLGTGFNAITASLSALKRQDPLAFIGGVAYQKTFEKDNLEPGQQFRFFMGAALATSPETSLRVVFDHTFITETKVSGTEVSGSDRAQGILSFGAASLIGRATLLNVSIDVGLNRDAPDYSVRASVDRRFNLL